jgi:hypothetical protein
MGTSAFVTITAGTNKSMVEKTQLQTCRATEQEMM